MGDLNSRQPGLAKCTDTIQKAGLDNLPVMTLMYTAMTRIVSISLHFYGYSDMTDRYADANLASEERMIIVYVSRSCVCEQEHAAAR
jgi:hypothetical protein